MTVEVGAVIGERAIVVTRALLVRYAGASTDFNPIHWSDRAASSLGLDGVIAHGMLTMGVALRIVTDWVADPAAVLRYSAKFIRPVVVPDDDEGVELHCVGTVTAVTDSTTTIAIEVTCHGEKVLGAVTAVVATGGVA